jgi:hypothetical protein
MNKDLSEAARAMRAVNSPAQQQAARENGKKGGRPKEDWMILYYDGDDWRDAGNHLSKSEAQSGMDKMRKQDPDTEFKICRETDA